CRFAQQSDISLVLLSAGGQLLCYHPEQKPGAAKILWPGVRNDSLNSGFIPSSESAKPAIRRLASVHGVAGKKISRLPALVGRNELPIKSWAGDDAHLLRVRSVQPDHSVRLELLRVQPEAGSVTTSFEGSMAGDYDITVRWHREAVKSTEHEE